ncbi:MAG: ATP synthase F0 subunit B [Candidatus Sericytochromatia bacterium]|uniref:ATP synthase subunit b n=1 Tax=Candidatus Tanganyikabacteria bacterium TaxID=2961651 RepID=A0A937X8E2_9BACT|nr:ATP synthase F0 subunit B [Candidatus Tanganyikabacteria bacterium]
MILSTTPIWSDPGLWQFINFAILIALLVKFGSKPIAGLFKARQDEIAAQVLRAERALTEARRTLDEVKKIESEEHAILDNVHAGARTLAQSLAEDIDREAKAEAEHLKASAKAEIDRERHALLSEARAALLKEAFEIAEQRIRDSLTPERHRALFAEFAAKASEVRP